MQQAIVNFVFDRTGDLIAGGIILVLLVLVAGVFIYDRRASIREYNEHRREIRIQRGIEMGRKQKAAREAYVLSLLADVVTDGLEEAWFAGKITDDERNWAYRKVGTRGVHDCIPKRTQAQVKAIVKGRRYHGTPSPAQEHPSWGAPPPTPPKPGDKPSQATNVINAKKKFGAKALDRLKKTA